MGHVHWGMGVCRQLAPGGLSCVWGYARRRRRWRRPTGKRPTDGEEEADDEEWAQRQADFAEF